MAPVPVNAPRLIAFNRGLAEFLGLDLFDASEADLAELFSGNRVPESAQPVAMAYAGHQFGNFVPQLGDGRAILLGEVEDADGVLRDIHLKGAGATPFSRGGDGRSALGPVIREYLVSETMHALGVPTTRALAMVTTGERVIREDIRPGGVIARVATSHVRVGTFEYFARNGDQEGVRQLADYVLDRHYPELKTAENPYAALLQEVTRRTGDLVAQWMLVGFIHGVMNTDNTSISGETIDYGPCAFLDTYDPGEGVTCGIVYMVTKKNCERLAEDLRRWDVPAHVYHAGLPERDKEAIQERWMREDGVILSDVRP